MKKDRLVTKNNEVNMAYFMKTITRDLIAHMRDEGYLDRVYTTKLYKSGKLDYDRHKWIKVAASNFSDYMDKEDVYDSDIESLAIQILQMIHYGMILYKDDNGKTLRKDNKLTE